MDNGYFGDVPLFIHLSIVNPLVFYLSIHYPVIHGYLEFSNRDSRIMHLISNFVPIFFFWFFKLFAERDSGSSQILC